MNLELIEKIIIGSFGGLVILGSLVALFFLNRKVRRDWKAGNLKPGWSFLIFGDDLLRFWQNGLKLKIKVGDKWRTITEIKTNEDGTWKTIKRNVPKPMITRR